MPQAYQQYRLNHQKYTSSMAHLEVIRLNSSKTAKHSQQLVKLQPQYLKRSGSRNPLTKQMAKVSPVINVQIRAAMVAIPMTSYDPAQPYSLILVSGKLGTQSFFLQYSSCSIKLILFQAANNSQFEQYLNQKTRSNLKKQHQYLYIRFIFLHFATDIGQLVSSTSQLKNMQDAVGDFKVWYFSKPLATRTYLAACVVITLLCTLGVLSPTLLFYSFRQTFLEFNIWRPISALFYMGKFNFSFIFNIYFAYIALMKVETQIFSKERYADFLWLLVLLFLGCLIIGSIIDIFWFTNPFLMALIYIWCKRLPHEEVTFMFGFKVKTGYFPFVYAIAMTLFGSSLIPYVVGIMLGHAYIFVKDIAVVRYHKDYLPTPRWFANWWYGRHGEGPVRQPQAGGFFAGRGVRLE